MHNTSWHHSSIVDASKSSADLTLNGGGTTMIPRHRISPHKRTVIVPRMLLLLILVGIPTHTTGQEGNETDLWISLFNGRDLSDWIVKFKGSDLGNNYLDTFRSDNGTLKVSYDGWSDLQGEFGHLFYDGKFSHYLLRVEYRFIGDQAPNGPAWAYRNNGIMLHSQSPASMTRDQEFPVSIEVQLLGGNGRERRPTANVCSPGTHFVMDDKLVTRHCTNSTSETFHGDQWVNLEVEVRGNRLIKHKVNGVEVFAYTRPQLDENDGDARRLIEQGQSVPLKEGFIAIQAESHPTEFRKIEILPLSE